MSQVKYNFDNETLIKIGKGALIAGTGAAGLYLLSILGAIEFSNPVLTSFLAWFIPTAVNLIREYMKGEGVAKMNETPEPAGRVPGELEPPPAPAQ